MKTTLNKIEKFQNAAHTYFIRVKEDSQLKYAINKQKEFIDAIIKKTKSQVRDIEYSLCAVDKDKHIIRDEYGRLKFTRELQIELEKKINELMELDIEIDNYIISEIPNDLTEEEKQSFEGFVI